MYIRTFDNFLIDRTHSNSKHGEHHDSVWKYSRFVCNGDLFYGRDVD